jgi:hypothetical protein
MPMTDSPSDLPAERHEPPRPQDLLRIGNAERELVVQRVQDAFAEGRLDAEELQQRLDAVYRARTMGELTPLTADLPVPQSRSLADPRPARVPRPQRPVARRRVPTALRILWIIWITAVAVNVAAWLVVCVTTGDLIYAWPLWVAGPAGAALLVLTVVLGRDEPAAEDTP